MIDDIDLYMDAYNKQEEHIRLIQQALEIKFPGIKGIIVTNNLVSYKDDRYSADEVHNFLLELKKP